MAKLLIAQTEYAVPDGSAIAQVCENAGIPFSCNSGVCGTCQIEVIEGADNLNELNREETELAQDRNHRLSCQCKIISGTVKVIF